MTPNEQRKLILVASNIVYNDISPGALQDALTLLSMLPMESLSNEDIVAARQRPPVEDQDQEDSPKPLEELEGETGVPSQDENEGPTESSTEAFSGKLWVDPPSGWKYGFPKIWEKKEGQTLEEWLEENGYPVKEFSSVLKYTRHWEADKEDL